MEEPSQNADEEDPEDVPEEETEETDLAYVSDLKINKIVSEDDGEEILPEENRSRVIYAPQQVGYALEYRTASFSDAVFDTWNMEFEMLLPVSDTVAQWDTDSMNWLNQGWTIQTEDCLYDFDGDGAEEQKTCQVLRGDGMSFVQTLRSKASYQRSGRYG